MYRYVRTFRVMVALAFAGAAAFVPSTSAQSIGGHVYVTLGDGSSQVIRGSEVFLVCATLENRSITDTSLSGIERISQNVQQHHLQVLRSFDVTKKRSIAEFYGAVLSADSYLPRLSQALYQQLSTGAIARGRTSVEGKYEFQDVPPGDYFVVGRYVTNFNDVVWREPVTVGASASQTVDLSNFNAHDLHSLLGMSSVERNRRMAEEIIIRLYPDDADFQSGTAQVRQHAERQPLPDFLTVRLSCS